MEAGQKSDFGVIDLQEADRSPEGMLLRLEDIVGRYASDFAVGIGVPGIVRTKDGHIVQSPNFPSWNDFDLSQRLSLKIRRPVSLENDANAFLRAECTLGAAQGEEHVLGLTLGTGLGGALWTDGHIHHGARGMAGELGHVSFEPKGVQCGCGSRGCIEQYASTQFLARRAQELEIESVKDVPMVRVGRILAEEGRAGDPQALALYKEMGVNLGIAVAGMVNLCDVAMIVTGGGLSGAYDLFGQSFEQTVAARVYRAMAQDLRFEVAKLGREAGAIGAALLAFSDDDDLTP
jgi:glucokinase